MAGPPLCTPRKCQLLWCHPSLGSRNKTFTPTSKAYRQIGIHCGESKTMNQFPNPLAQHENPLRGFPGGLNKSDSTKDCPKETGRFYFPPLSMFPVLENKNVLFAIESVCACVRLKLRLYTHCKNHCTKNHGKRQLAEEIAHTCLPLGQSMSLSACVPVCAPECASGESKRRRSNSNSKLVIIVVAGNNSGAGSGSNSNSNSERDQHLGARLGLQTCVAGCMK